MAARWTLLSSSPELLADALALAGPRASELSFEVEEKPERAAASRAGRTALALGHEPDLDACLALHARALEHAMPIPVAWIGARSPAIARLRELGLATFVEIGPLVSAMLMLSAGGTLPATASVRGLGTIDRVRFASTSGERGAGRMRRGDEGRIVWESPDGASFDVGRPWDVAEAMRVLRATPTGERPSMPRVEGVDTQAVLDVILGPQRALSDPASKAALDPYDLPVPVEELCATPSRAASEAARIGFPVRVTLASPELRASEHPDLVVDGVEGAARVRDVFRQLMALAETKARGARVLGVTVSATTTARALLRLDLRLVADDLVEATLGFADPHGVASDDRTVLVLPASAEAIETALSRLQGASLVLAGGPADRRQTVTAVGDVLLRLAAFLHDFPSEIERVTIDPLAILVGGSVEVREACVHVSSAFERTLGDAGPTG